jgi:hypothetical protein
MFNTTTIPSQLPETMSVNFFFNLCALFSTGLIMGVSLVEIFLYKMRMRERREKGEGDSDSDSESSGDEDEGEGEEEEEKYIERYCDEFDALPVRELSVEELQSLNTKIVREQVTTDVEVILTFDKTTDTFWYYTDQLKKVSYPILETVARKFMLEHDCKILRLQGGEQQVARGLPQASLPQASRPHQSSPGGETPQEVPPSVFAKFKKYNTGGKGSTPNFTSVVKVVEQMNHFRYRGKIYDYEATQKLSEKKEEAILDYASYKILCEKKKN